MGNLLVATTKAAGDVVTVIGRPFTHLVREVRGFGSVRLACRPRWYGSHVAKVTDRSVTCQECVAWCAGRTADEIAGGGAS